MALLLSRLIFIHLPYYSRHYQLQITIKLISEEGNDFMIRKKIAMGVNV